MKNFYDTVKKLPKKSSERHGDVNPNNLTASFAGIRAQSRRSPLGTVTQMLLVTVQDEPDHWFFNPNFEEGVSSQIPGLAAATRSEPHRLVLWGLSCAVWWQQDTLCPWKQCSAF